LQRLYRCGSEFSGDSSVLKEWCFRFLIAAVNMEIVKRIGGPLEKGLRD